jgi:IclR family transcriptional regulator, KDG regulon repressor
LNNGSNDGLAITDIARLSGLHKATVHRIVTTLVKYEYLYQREKKGKYCLGSMFLNFSAIIKKGFKLRNVASPYLLELSKRIDEVVILSLLVNETKDKLYSEPFYDPQSNHALQVTLHGGAWAPLHSTSLGKIVLANMSDEDLKKFFSQQLRKYTSNTITDLDAMKHHLALTAVKEKDIAIDDEENWVGVRSVAIPLRSNNNTLLGAICVVAPSVRLGFNRINELATDLKQCSSTIAKYYMDEDPEVPGSPF